MWRRIAAIAGNLLIILGIGAFLAIGALYIYGRYERYRFERELAQALAMEETNMARATESAAPTSVSMAVTASPVVSDVTALVPPAPTSEPTTAVPTPKPAPTPTPTPLPQPPKRIVIPKIGVDSLVVPAKIEDGEWKVPKFVAGHLEGTANPGQGSNVALSGHVESISSGNVFARLGELKPSDAISLFTQDREFRYAVKETRVVKNNDLSVVAPTTEETLTLITCTGTWLPLARDYDRRLVVIAKLESPERHQQRMTGVAP